MIIKSNNDDYADNDNVCRQGRGWCDDSFGVFCMLFNVIKGDEQGKIFRISTRTGYIAWILHWIPDISQNFRPDTEYLHIINPVDYWIWYSPDAGHIYRRPPGYPVLPDYQFLKELEFQKWREADKKFFFLVVRPLFFPMTTKLEGGGRIRP